MSRVHFLSFMTAALLALLSSCTDAAYPFVKVEDGRFKAEDYPSHFIGANFWYGAILASDGTGGDIQRLEKELDDLKGLGVNNLRVLVGGDGPDGVQTRIMPTLQKEPGVYNDTIFRGLDRLLVEMAERDMKAVLYINNTWEWSGGFGMYLEWAGAGQAKLPAVDGYKAFTEYTSQFVTNEKAKKMFADHVRHVVSRTNTISGKPYSEDPAIFSWQIGNEPRCFRKDSLGRAAFADWMWETAALIKSIDPNHMVSSGSEGVFGCEVDMGLFEKIHACPDIDYMTMHIWPKNWSWVSESTLKSELSTAIEYTDKYIDAHLPIAQKHNKPIVIEEFGYPRDDYQFRQGTPVTARNEYYQHIYNRVIESAKEAGILAGANYWAWGGSAGQSDADGYTWHPGDDYCGDPAQEPQGLYSVYIDDNWTNLITLKSVQDLRKALLPQVSFKIMEENGIFETSGLNVVEVGIKYPYDLRAEFEFIVETEFGEPVMTYSEKLKLEAGVERSLSFDVDMKPGFYKVRVNMLDAKGESCELVSRFLGCQPELISSPQDKQPDFDQFWKNTLDQLASVAPEYKLSLIKEKSNDIRRTYRVDMKSFGNEDICGIYVEPVAKGKYPAMIYYMGYNTQPWDIDPSANPQMSEFILCIRNQGLNMKSDEKIDWLTRGLESHENYYYRGAIADAIRAIDFICSREKTDLSRVFAQGESQGGALTYAAASLDDRLRAVAPSAPFLCDFPDFLKLAKWPSNELKEKAAELGMGEEDLLKVLSYFDMKNMTDRISCPLILGVGLQDDICPIHTNFAGYNMVKTEKSWTCFPFATHNVWVQPEWSEQKKEYFASFR